MLKPPTSIGPDYRILDAGESLRATDLLPYDDHTWQSVIDWQPEAADELLSGEFLVEGSPDEPLFIRRITRREKLAFKLLQSFKIEGVFGRGSAQALAASAFALADAFIDLADEGSLQAEADTEVTCGPAGDSASGPHPENLGCGPFVPSEHFSHFPTLYS